MNDKILFKEFQALSSYFQQGTFWIMCSICLVFIIFLIITITYTWYNGHSTSLNACGEQGTRVKVQVFRREPHTHIHLDQARVKILSISKIKFKKKNLDYLNIFFFNFLFQYLVDFLDKKECKVRLDVIKEVEFLK